MFVWCQILISCCLVLSPLSLPVRLLCAAIRRGEQRLLDQLGFGISLSELHVETTTVIPSWEELRESFLGFCLD